jgi:hypothetical protein
MIDLVALFIIILLIIASYAVGKYSERKGLTAPVPKFLGTAFGKP